MKWKAVTKSEGHRVIEAPGAIHNMEINEIENYAENYANNPNPLTPITLQLWMDEVFSEFEPGSSLLIFGSGHPFHANTYHEKLNLGDIVCMDIVSQAGEGLNPNIEFVRGNILIDEIKDYDYIFSSHTIEHFTRDEVMNILLPKCLNHARKAVVFLAPYRDIGWGLPSARGPHIINLSEEDELTAKALKWKRIRDNPTATPPQYGIELVLWFEGEINKK